MRHSFHRTPGRWIFGVLAAALLLVALPASAADTVTAQPPEEFVGNLIDNKGAIPGVSSAWLRLRIEEYGNDEQAMQLLAILEEKGQRGLREHMIDRRVGWIRIGNTEPGYPVAFARTFENEAGRVVQAVIARPLGFLELKFDWRTTDYPFSIVELLIDEEGRGSGVFVAATKFEYEEEDNRLIVESYDYPPFQILSIKRRELSD